MWTKWMEKKSTAFSLLSKFSPNRRFKNWEEKGEIEQQTASRRKTENWNSKKQKQRKIERHKSNRNQADWKEITSRWRCGVNNIISRLIDSAGERLYRRRLAALCLISVHLCILNRPRVRLSFILHTHTAHTRAMVSESINASITKSSRDVYIDRVHNRNAHLTFGRINTVAGKRLSSNFPNKRKSK